MFTDVMFNKEEMKSSTIVATAIHSPEYIPFSDSLILSSSDAMQLYTYINISMSSDKLLYRGTRDGFIASSFHSLCNETANTVTVIKTDSDYVFGGYTASPWKSDYSYGNDPTAFIFSLRRNGEQNNQKFTVNDARTAIYNSPYYGPVFGSNERNSYSDIIVSLNRDSNNYADFGSSYNTGSMAPLSEEAKNYLAGKNTLWKVMEIEVYQIVT
jgi:hypothetical protein